MSMNKNSSFTGEPMATDAGRNGLFKLWFEQNMETFCDMTEFVKARMIDRWDSEHTNFVHSCNDHSSLV
jgi:hypothetical protein